LVEFGGYNPYGTTIRKSVGKKTVGLGAQLTIRVKNPLRRKLWKPVKKEGYFIYPIVSKRLPELQAEYIRQLDKLVDRLYGKAQASVLPKFQK